MSDRWRDYIVTTEPDLEAKLRARYSELGGFEIANYAYSLGLYPPGYEEGQKHSVSGYTPLGEESESYKYLVWDAGLESPGVDDEVSEPDDGYNPWEGIVPITKRDGPKEVGGQGDEQ